MKRQRKALRVSLKQEARRRLSEDGLSPVETSPRSSPYGTPTSTRSGRSTSGRSFKSSLGGPDQVKAFKVGAERILGEYFESMDLGEAAAQLTTLEEGEADVYQGLAGFSRAYSGLIRGLFGGYRGLSGSVGVENRPQNPARPVRPRACSLARDCLLAFDVLARGAPTDGCVVAERRLARRGSR
eukprot:2674300-Pyramimonas_sp.AAC.1